MGVTHRKRQVLARDRRAESDAVHLQRLLITFGDALDHIGEQRARQAMQRPMLLALGWARNGQRPVLLTDLQVGVELTSKGALRPLHRHAPAVSNGYLDALRNLYRALANS